MDGDRNRFHITIQRKNRCFSALLQFSITNTTRIIDDGQSYHETHTYQSSYESSVHCYSYKGVGCLIPSARLSTTLVTLVPLAPLVTLAVGSTTTTTTCHHICGCGCGSRCGGSRTKKSVNERRLFRSGRERIRGRGGSVVRQKRCVGSEG